MPAVAGTLHHDVDVGRVAAVEDASLGERQERSLGRPDDRGDAEAGVARLLGGLEQHLLLELTSGRGRFGPRRTRERDQRGDAESGGQDGFEARAGAGSRPGGQGGSPAGAGAGVDATAGAGPRSGRGTGRGRVGEWAPGRAAKADLRRVQRRDGMRRPALRTAAGQSGFSGHPTSNVRAAEATWTLTHPTRSMYRSCSRQFFPACAPVRRKAGGRSALPRSLHDSIDRRVRLRGASCVNPACTADRIVRPRTAPAVRAATARTAPARDG